MEIGDLAAANFVTADVNYLDDPHKIDDGQRLHYYADFSRTTNARLAPRPVRICDARPFAAQFSLDRQGFEIAEFATKITDFTETEAIAPQYMAECTALI